MSEIRAVIIPLDIATRAAQQLVALGGDATVSQAILAAVESSRKTLRDDLSEAICHAVQSGGDTRDQLMKDPNVIREALAVLGQQRSSSAVIKHLISHRIHMLIANRRLLYTKLESGVRYRVRRGA